MASKCPKCGGTHLVKLYTLYLKVCGDCGLRIEWKVKEALTFATI